MHVTSANAKAASDNATEGFMRYSRFASLKMWKLQQFNCVIDCTNIINNNLDSKPFCGPGKVVSIEDS